MELARILISSATSAQEFVKVAVSLAPAWRSGEPEPGQARTDETRAEKAIIFVIRGK
jgi:hypothetical protein